MRRILRIDVPYDCGQFGSRMGAGPPYLIERGLAPSLRAAGCAVRLESVRLSEAFHTEWQAQYCSASDAPDRAAAKLSILSLDRLWRQRAGRALHACRYLVDVPGRRQDLGC